MSRGSLRLRLALAGIVAIGASLALAGWGLTLLFAAHVERRAVSELETHLDQVLGGLEKAADGTLTLTTPPADPRFRQPYGGLYWQVQAGGDVLRSRSLWDWQLDVPRIAPADGLAVLDPFHAPDGRRLLGVERSVVLPPSLGGETITLILAMERAELGTAIRAFATDLTPYLGLLAIALMGAGWWQLRVGLSPLGELGRRLAAIRSGAAQRLGGRLPREVSPLAADFDALLDSREAEMAAAQRRASDLAHGLKTPLQALLGESQRLHRAGHTQAAAALETIAGTMRRHVDRELTRTRIASRTAGARCDVNAVIAQVVAVAARTPAGAQLQWDHPAAPATAMSSPTVSACEAALAPADLTEALGALVENATRYARERITIRCHAVGEQALLIEVQDDGPGVPEPALSDLLTRGARLDTQSGHTGLGLAICREIAEAAGGELRLENATPGLLARLRLPRADRASVPSVSPARRGSAQ